MTDFGYSFGIEEEFFLSSASSGTLATRVPRTLIADARRVLGETIRAEMLQSQIEVASPIFQHCADASVGLGRLRRSLAELVDEHDLRLIAAGTHPCGGWRSQRITNHARYAQMAADFGIVGRRNLVCGLHVHVATPPGVDRIDIMNRAMRWLPLLLALSTSSPFWSGRQTGLLSYRQALYDEWPRSGLPDYFTDEADYAAFTARMVRARAMHDITQQWWAIRPAVKYPTLELRITDACTRVEDSVAIAALFRCLVAALVENRSLGARRTTHTRRVIDENRWRAKRDGIGAWFIAEGSSEVDAVPIVLSETLALLGEQIQRLDCADALWPLQRLMRIGSSAHEQVRIYNEARSAGRSHGQALRRVVAWLECTTLGRDIHGTDRSDPQRMTPADQYSAN
jgi:glutamate---cysteine ligase / carboxylate-amine ligase